MSQKSTIKGKIKPSETRKRPDNPKEEYIYTDAQGIVIKEI